MGSQADNRRHELDWLRVLAVLLLIYFHSARPFDFGDFYVKNGVLSEGFDAFTMFVDIWFMPLFFFIAGGASYFALAKRSGRQYAGERAKRLLVPFVFGTLVIAAPQVYVVLRQQPGNTMNYLQYYRYIFTTPYLTEVTAGSVGPAQINAFTLEPAHLWFIIYLFVFSMVCLPLFLRLRGDKGSKFKDRMESFLRRRGAILLFAVPIFLYVALDIEDDTIDRLFLIYPFFIGFLFYSDERFGRVIDEYLKPALIAAVAFSAAIIAMYTTVGFDSQKALLGGAFLGALYALTTWLWLIALVGLGRRYLRFRNGFLDYANRGSYPFYILHQTVIVLIAYVVYSWTWGIIPKYLLITTASLAITLAAYDLLVRRTRPTRFLFGMK
ncbi:MAG: acyltransferase [Actinomycetota bacterium]